MYGICLMQQSCYGWLISKHQREWCINFGLPHVSYNGEGGGCAEAGAQNLRESLVNVLSRDCNACLCLAVVQ